MSNKLHHENSDWHVIQAYCLRHDYERYKKVSGTVGYRYLQNRGLCEEIRRTWLVRKGLHEAMKAKKEVITSIGTDKYFEILREQFKMPEL